MAPYVMRDFPTYQKAARKYWERRRIAYNLALVLPAMLGYGISGATHWHGDPHEKQYPYLLILVLLHALGANVCYSFVYALEFIFGTDDPDSRWTRFFRKRVFAAGVVFAMMLALAGGRQIADMEWYAIVHD